MIRLILTIVLSALAFVSIGANDCTDVVLHEWDTDETRMPKLIKDETGREEYDGTEKPEHLVTWVYDGTSFTPVAKVTDSERYTIVHDYLGTPTEAYDTNGNEVWSRMLDMDGNALEETGNVGMIPFLFQGQYYDCETGLAYNRFRYYSPKMGMYVSQDPIGLAGGILNLYGYVDDTNAWIDALGLKSYNSQNLKVGDELAPNTTVKRIRKGTNGKMIVIGRSMDSRIIPAAKNINAEHWTGLIPNYHPKLTFLIIGDG